MKRTWTAVVPRGLKLAAGVALCMLAAGAQAQAMLPSYQPVAVTPSKDAGYVLPDGSIRVVGAGEMAGIVAGWNALFAKTHPGVRFTYVKSDSLAAIDSLMFDSTAMALSRQEFAPSLTYSGIVHGDPYSVRVAHASLNPQASFSPWAVVVNKANPMTKISIGQLTSIFSQGTRSRVFARWSQAGVKGELADIEIRPVGLPWSDHYPSEDTTYADGFFARKLGANEPVRTYVMVPTYADVVKDVAAHPEAIGVTTLNRVTPDVKVIAIARGSLKGPATGSAEEIGQGQYPLDRYLRVYARVSAGKPFDPFVREYLRMVLSKEGQQIVADDSQGYLPLNAFEAHEDLAGLE